MNKRKYRKGGKITSLDELAKQEFVYFEDKITNNHRGWFMSRQGRLAQLFIELGVLCYVERIGGERE